jgi:tetratricopeptide (TPR) repeat protein
VQSTGPAPLGAPATTGATSDAETSPSVDSIEVEIGRRIQLGLLASDSETLLHGRRAFSQGDDEAALECLTRLTAHGLRYADVFYMIGMLKERRGELDAALTHLQEAVRINPAYVEALLALASLHERRGDFDRSRGYAERASQLARPIDGRLDATTRAKLANQQAQLADALAAAGELRDAIDEYRKALDRCPTFHDVRHKLAIVLREAGLPAQAARELQQILRARPSLLESQIQLGLTYYSMGRTPQAIAEWNAVLEKDPSRDAARMYLRLVRGADSSTRPTRGRPPEAAAGATGAEEPESSVSGWSTAELARGLEEHAE